MEFFENGQKATKEALMHDALNEVLRDWYVDDCAINRKPVDCEHVRTET